MNIFYWRTDTTIHLLKTISSLLGNCLSSGPKSDTIPRAFGEITPMRKYSQAFSLFFSPIASRKTHIQLISHPGCKFKYKSTSLSDERRPTAFAKAWSITFFHLLLDVLPINLSGEPQRIFIFWLEKLRYYL